MKLRSVIVFKGKYGATAQYAAWLGQALQAPVYDQAEINNDTLNQYDVVIAGGSVYVGRIQVAKWMNKRKNILRDKHLFLFVVCASADGNDGEHVKMLSRNICTLLLEKLTTVFIKGRLIKGKLSVIDNLILRAGASLQKTAEAKKRMLSDFDEVKKENLGDLVKAVKSLSVYSSVD